MAHRVKSWHLNHFNYSSIEDEFHLMKIQHELLDKISKCAEKCISL